MIQLSRTFRPTHQTAGLPGYPAIDHFGKAGETVGAPFAGTVRRLSGHDPSKGGRPGGPYGWSIYLQAANGDDAYMTHFGTRKVKVGQKVKRGEIIGTICDSRVSGKPGTSHIHYGLKKAKRPLPEQHDRLYRVSGPKGGNIARRKTAEQVGKNTTRWVRRFGSISIRPDEHAV